MHTVDRFILKEELIVLRDGNKEEDSGDVLKAMDPLLSLRSLSSNIEHTVCKVSNDEGGFSDTSSLDTGAQNILVIWHVVMLGNALDVVEVAMVTRSATKIRHVRHHLNTYYLAESFN